MSLPVIVVIVCAVIMLISIGVFGYFIGKKTSVPKIDYHKAIKEMADKMAQKEEELARLEQESLRLVHRIKEIESENQLAEEERKKVHEELREASMSDIDAVIYEHHQLSKGRK